MGRDLREVRWLAVALVGLGCQKPQQAGPAPEPSASAPAIDGKAEFADVVCKSIALSGTKERARVAQVEEAVRWAARTVKHPALKKSLDDAGKAGVYAYGERITEAAKAVGANVRPCTLLETLAKLPKGPVVTIEGEKVLFEYKPVDTLADATAAKASGKPVAMPGLGAAMKAAAKTWGEAHPPEPSPKIFALEAPPDLDAFLVKCVMLTAMNAGYGTLEPYRP